MVVVWSKLYQDDVGLNGSGCHRNKGCRLLLIGKEDRIGLGLISQLFSVGSALYTVKPCSQTTWKTGFEVQLYPSYLPLQITHRATDHAHCLSLCV